MLTRRRAAGAGVVDAVARLVPGVVGDEESVAGDSFARGLLDYPHYTRPAEFRGLEVPDVLCRGTTRRSGAGASAQALRRTLERRPDLLDDGAAGRRGAARFCEELKDEGASHEGD